jgi:regulator of sigma E protease
VKQVREDAMRVVKTLAKLINGKISPTNLGGPGTIAMAATSEASRSTSRLLLFLTFLSANLAVVNFLPIPILDGGHMLFLAYEGIFRRPVSERVQVVLTYGGLFMILGLMLFVIFLDIGRIVSL